MNVNLPDEVAAVFIELSAILDRTILVAAALKPLSNEAHEHALDAEASIVSAVKKVQHVLGVYTSDDILKN